MVPMCSMSEEEIRSQPDLITERPYTNNPSCLQAETGVKGRGDRVNTSFFYDSNGPQKKHMKYNGPIKC